MAERLALTSEIVRELTLQSPLLREVTLDESDIDRELQAESNNDLEYFE